MSSPITAAAQDRAYYEDNLPEEHRTPENVQRCMCVGCDHYDQYKFGANRCGKRSECDKLRAAGKAGHYKRRKGGDTVVLKPDVIAYVVSGVVL